MATMGRQVRGTGGSVSPLLSRLRGSASSEANLASNIDRSDTNIAFHTEADLGRGIGASLEFPVESI